MFKLFVKVYKPKSELQGKQLAEQCRELNNLLTDTEDIILEDCLTARELSVRLIDIQQKYGKLQTLISELNKVRIYSYWIEKTTKRIEQIKLNIKDKTIHTTAYTQTNIIQN